MSQNFALIGNPNVGKSTIFNLLTNGKQKIANYPGVTLDLATGNFSHKGEYFTVLDLPGTYNLYPTSLDEEIVLKFLRKESTSNKENITIGVVANATDLKKSLLVLGQIADMGFKVVFILNMMDEVSKRKIEIDLEGLKKDLGVKVISISAKTGGQINDLKEILIHSKTAERPFYKLREEMTVEIAALADQLKLANSYLAWQYFLTYSPAELRTIFPEISLPKDWHPVRQKTKETVDRYTALVEILDKNVNYTNTESDFSSKLDKVLINPISGYLIFGFILLILFNAVYSWSAPTIDFIDNLINVDFGGLLAQNMAEGPFTNLLLDGVLPGISGVLVFVPQITLLFFFLILLEESGYMSRVVFLMDKWLRPFGLNGKSIVPLISGIACAIPAVMATRTIESKKERLISILVTPFMTCSARLPVYTVLIALVIPQGKFLCIEYQALVLLGMYLLGVFFVLGSALILKYSLKTKYESYLITELPSYSYPNWKNFFTQLWDKVISFVLGAGKIIFSISVLMWLMSQIGWNDAFRNAEKIAIDRSAIENTDVSVGFIKLENSLLGMMGKAIEPAIKPLGYDWKIGIGILSSFAAREVFIGTMSTIYSLENDDVENNGIIAKMKAQTNPKTGEKIYNLATGCSLLVFYALAMQCMSTVAVVKKETNGWFWPIVQLSAMSVLAYFFAFITYSILL